MKLQCGTTLWLVFLSGLSCVMAEPKKETVAYKTVEGHEIQADVFYDDSKKGPRPAVVWLHGGGVINGHRESVPAQVRDFASSNGYVLISLDYRLAPETKLPGVVSDLEDAFRWMRGAEGARYGIDSERIAVTGGSAGGFLTLITGFRVKPAPRVLLAFWGYGEILSDWATKPSPHPRHHERKIDAAAVAASLDGPVVSDSRLRKADSVAIYLHGRQSGKWAEYVAGANLIANPEKLWPFLPLKNVEPGFPPTVLIHGTADTDVPFEQSQMLAREFEKHGVLHQLHAIEGGEHGLGGGDPAAIKAAHELAFTFVKGRLESR